jgi:hypothetical protein
MIAERLVHTFERFSQVPEVSRAKEIAEFRIGELIIEFLDLRWKLIITGQNFRHSRKVRNDIRERPLELGKIGTMHVVPELDKFDFHRSLSCTAGDTDPSLVGVTRPVLRICFF